MSSEKVRKWGAGGVRVVCWVPAAFVDLPRSCAGATLLAGHVGLGSLRLVSVRRFALAYCRFGAAAAVRPWARVATGAVISRPGVSNHLCCLVRRSTRGLALVW